MFVQVIIRDLREINQVHLQLGMTQQSFHQVHPLVRDGLKQGILPVLALVVDVDVGMFDELPHSRDIPVPYGKGEGSGAVVGGEIDVERLQI